MADDVEIGGVRDAFALRTEKLFSGLWEVTRSISEPCGQGLAQGSRIETHNGNCSTFLPGITLWPLAITRAGPHDKGDSVNRLLGGLSWETNSGFRIA